MNVKDEARNILADFYSLISGMELSFISKMIQFPSGDSHFETAKSCARIHVKRMINEHTWKNPISWNEVRRKTWEAVLNEIEKL